MQGTLSSTTGAWVCHWWNWCSHNEKKNEAWINTFTHAITYLLRCNTDVTSLASSTAIKGVIIRDCHGLQVRVGTGAGTGWYLQPWGNPYPWAQVDGLVTGLVTELSLGVIWRHNFQLEQQPQQQQQQQLGGWRQQQGRAWTTRKSPNDARRVLFGP